MPRCINQLSVQFEFHLRTLILRAFRLKYISSFYILLAVGFDTSLLDGSLVLNFILHSLRTKVAAQEDTGQDKVKKNHFAIQSWGPGKRTRMLYE